MSSMRNRILPEYTCAVHRLACDHVDIKKNVKYFDDRYIGSILQGISISYFLSRKYDKTVGQFVRFFKNGM